MSEHFLPEDPGRWPSDPFELLGVPRDVSARDLRRAYTRLILRYRPEEFPDQFQRIRAAYERAQQIIEWRDAAGVPGSSEPASEFPRSPNEFPAAEPPAPRPRRSESPASHPGRGESSFEERMEIAWRLARDGDVRRGYDQFVQLCGERPFDTAPVLRLYWLLVIAPEAAPGRVPVDVLCEGLIACRFPQPLLTLYERELIRDPSLVNAAAGGLLLSEAPLDLIEDLSDTRWFAAGRCNAWSVIESDLEIVRGRLALDTPLEWARTLFSAVGYVARSPSDVPRDLMARCLSELESFRNQELQLSEEFEALTRLQDILALPALDDLPGGEGLALLLRESWKRSASDLRTPLLSIIEGWLEDPAMGLKQLDGLRQKSPAALEQVWHLVRQLPIRWELLRRDVSDQDSLAVIHEFLQTEILSPYPQWRERLARFCIDEIVSTDEVIEFLCTHSMMALSDDAARAISTDLPVRCLQHGCVAFQDAMIPEEVVAM